MPRRVLEGRVVSDKMDKTVTVLVERRYMHPMYKKYVKRTDKYAAHDEDNMAREGDLVMIEECRPISKRKTWKLVTGAESQSAASEPKSAAKPTVKKVEPAKEKPTKTAAKKAPAKKPVAKKAAPKAKK